MPETNWFKDDELRCPCGCGLAAFDPAMLSVLNRARGRWGRPLRLSSACRCAGHNAAVGGARRSAHLVGPDGLCHAADVLVESDVDRGLLREIFSELGVRRFEASDLHLHVDNAWWLPTPLLKAVVFGRAASGRNALTRRKLKSVGELIPAILGVIPAIVALFKKKKFVLWYHGPDKQPYLLCDFAILRLGVSPGPGWVRKSDPMSKRQCEQQRDELWALGPGVPVTPVFPKGDS